jgi:hypothetical protein
MVENKYKNLKLYCNQKERVRKHTAHWLPLTNPGAHVLLIYSTQFRPSITHITLTAFNEPRRPCSPDLLHTVQTFDNTQHISLPTDPFRRTLQDQKCTNALLPHNNRTNFAVSISYLSHSHRCQLGKLSHYITDYIHSPKARACSPSNVHKTPDSQCCLLSLSLVPLRKLDRLPGAAESSSIQPS